MIPLRDNVAPRRLMPVNMALIAANVAVFAFEVSLGGHAGRFVGRYAMVPVRISYAIDSIVGGSPLFSEPSSLGAPLTLATSMFLHGGFWHIAGNMLFLFIFGAAIEDRLGSARFFCLYIASGIVAGLATVIVAPASRVPVIGASGAIAGVLGAYFVLYPRARILTLLPIFIFIQVVELPAVVYLLVWFVVQLFSGLAQGATGAVSGGIAWWAHIGGFLFGVAMGPLLAHSPRYYRRLR